MASSQSSKTEFGQMLDQYVLDFLRKRSLHKCAELFALEAKVPERHVAIDAPDGFLYEWWAVFWEIFVARTKSASSPAAVNYLEVQRAKRARHAQLQPAQHHHMRTHPHSYRARAPDALPVATSHSAGNAGALLGCHAPGACGEAYRMPADAAAASSHFNKLASLGLGLGGDIQAGGSGGGGGGGGGRLWEQALGGARWGGSAGGSQPHGQPGRPAACMAGQQLPPHLQRQLTAQAAEANAMLAQQPHAHLMQQLHALPEAELGSGQQSVAERGAALARLMAAANAMTGRAESNVAGGCASDGVCAASAAGVGGVGLGRGFSRAGGSQEAPPAAGATRAAHRHAAAQQEQHNNIVHLQASAQQRAMQHTRRAGGGTGAEGTWMDGLRGPNTSGLQHLSCRLGFPPFDQWGPPLGSLLSGYGSGGSDGACETRCGDTWQGRGQHDSPSVGGVAAGNKKRKAAQADEPAESSDAPGKSTGGALRGAPDACCGVSLGTRAVVSNDGAVDESLLHCLLEGSSLPFGALPRDPHALEGLELMGMDDGSLDLFLTGGSAEDKSDIMRDCADLPPPPRH
ncbi:hypothetical protein WJX81_002942 [Elliptochloris bilobata]|uniref:LisH domain-containing protein n=1 Tax=Elliptochloris bilobata TaxID=381761 RepID=A0AAW1RUC9_9CHLO